MKPIHILLLAVAAFAGCDRRDTKSPGGAGAQARNQPRKVESLAEARKGFQTKLLQRQCAEDPPPVPPPAIFRLVRYDAPGGKLPAFVTPDPADGKKHPAIVWIQGGNCNTMGDVWTDRPEENEQNAAAYRKAGIIMMFPGLRGGAQGAGAVESFMGEVDDVVVAADFLAKQPYVDPNRIYLGGHSTGGTLVLLVAECSDRFRAVFSFGPAANVMGYGAEFIPFDASNPKEAELRAPGLWLDSIKTPTFVLEGTTQSNIDDLRLMSVASKNPKIKFLPIRGATHFTILAPTNRLIAKKILADTGEECAITLTAQEVGKGIGK